jgi:hypothetical protein
VKNSDFIENYDQIERKSSCLFPNIILKSFAPTTFHALNFPTEVKSSDHLWKFIDTQHDGRFLKNLSLLGGGLTESEFQLLQKAVDICARFTKSINKELIPINALTRSLISYRAINDYCQSLNKVPSVLEIGPGSGYLGLLCGISGWRYSSLDVTKSLICYQNSLWNFADFKVKFAETGLKYLDSDFIQIPWWVWADIENSLPQREIIVANHVIQEMTPFSLSFSIKRAKELGAKYLTAESLGFANFENNLNIIFKNTDLIHNSPINNRYQSVWFWKLKDSNSTLLVDVNSLEAKTASQKTKRCLINVILKYKFSREIYRSINRLKSKKIFRNNTRELLDKSLLMPNVVFHKADIVDFIKSKKVPFLSDDELVIRWANHSGHI